MWPARGLHLTLEPKHPNVAEPYPHIYKDDKEGVFFVLHELGAGDLRDAMEGRVEGFRIDSPEKVKEFARELGGALVHLQGLMQEQPDMLFEKKGIHFFRCAAVAFNSSCTSTTSVDCGTSLKQHLTASYYLCACREVNPDNVIVVAQGGRLVVKVVNVLSYMNRHEGRDLGYHDP